MRSVINPEQPTLTRTQQARREDIIAAAIIVINRDGYAMASVAKIAQQAGTNKSTVLYHFKSKEALYEALIGTLFSDGAAYMGPYIVAAKTYRDKLRAYLGSNLRFISEHADHIAAVHQILQNNAPRDNDEGPVEWLEHMLKEGQLSGELGTFDPRITAMIIRLTIDSASSYVVAHPTLDIDRYIREITHMFDKVVQPDKGG